MKKKKKQFPESCGSFYLSRAIEISKPFTSWHRPVVGMDVLGKPTQHVAPPGGNPVPYMHTALHSRENPWNTLI